MSSPSRTLTYAERAATGITEGDLARAGQAVVPAAAPPSGLQQWEDVLAVLTWAAGFDRIQRGQFEAQAWLEVLRGKDVDEVREAITAHYRESRFPVMPADIIRIIEEGI